MNYDYEIIGAIWWQIKTKDFSTGEKPFGRRFTIELVSSTTNDQNSYIQVYNITELVK